MALWSHKSPIIKIFSKPQSAQLCFRAVSKNEINLSPTQDGFVYVDLDDPDENLNKIDPSKKYASGKVALAPLNSAAKVTRL